MTTPKSNDATGVNYGTLDEFKRLCQQRARRTFENALRLGYRHLEWTCGESVNILELLNPPPNYRIGAVAEGLGTKEEVAYHVQIGMGLNFWAEIAQDTVAMIVNDAATLRVAPAAILMELAVGDASYWFGNLSRVQAFVEGWGTACDLAGCVWAGGETPELKRRVFPDAAIMSGATVGPVVGKSATLNSSQIIAGDVMVLCESSGMHANSLTKCRDVANILPRGYATEVERGVTFGEALLEPTHIYCRYVEECVEAGVDIHYAVNVTGHGLRKLMRADTETPLAYVVDKLPTQRPIFDFLQEHGRISLRDSYAAQNRGVGFALYVPAEHADLACRIAERYPFRAYRGGHIEVSPLGKRVVIDPLGITYNADELQVR
jgi:phosphoribosylformylglycinamidine cyclo-ligase